MAGPLLLKRKTKKSPKRLGRPHLNKKLDLGRIFTLLNSLKKVLKSQKSPLTKRRLDFGNNSPQKSHVLPKPKIYSPKLEDLKPNATLKEEKVDRCNDVSMAQFFKVFHRIADEVVSDDEDLLNNCHRLAEKFATLKVSKDSQSKTENDCVMMESPNIPINSDETFFKACQRSAQKIAVAEIPKLENESLEPAIPKSNPSADLEIVPKPRENNTEDKIDKIPSEKLKAAPKPSQNEPDKTSKIGVPKSNPTSIIMCIDLTGDSPKKGPEPAKIKPEIPNSKLEVTKSPEIKPLEKNPKKPNSNSSPEKINSKTEVQDEKNSVSLKDFRFSTAEMKKVGEYNSNTFNATGESADPGQTSGQSKRYIIIDGSNVAFAHGNSSWFSSEGVKYCLQYFDKMGHNAKAVVPLFRRNAFQSTNPGILDQLHKEGKIVFTPCKNIPGQKSISYDDRFILQLAYELDGAVVSNDNFRDIIDESPAFKWIVENRVLGYTWCDNIFMLPKDPYGRRHPSLDEILLR